MISVVAVVVVAEADVAAPLVSAPLVSAADAVADISQRSGLSSAGAVYVCM